MAEPDGEIESPNYLYLYNIGSKIVKEFPLPSKVEYQIWGICHKFLKKSKKLEPQTCSFDVIGYVTKWMGETRLNIREIEDFSNRLREFLLTRSSEIQRNLLFLNSKETDEFYIIHLREDFSVIDELYQNIVNVGLSRNIVLRVFLFSKRNNSIHFEFWEKNPTKILEKLFNIKNRNFDSVSPLIKIYCTLNNLSYHISIDPTDFKEIYNKSLKFHGEKVKINNRDYDIISLKYKDKTYLPEEYENFVIDILKEENQINRDLEKALMEFQSKKLELGIKPKTNILAWIPGPEEYSIEEDDEYVTISINSGKPVRRHPKELIHNLMPIFLEDNEKYVLSEKFIEIMSAEIITLSRTNSICFLQVEYKETPFKIGKYEFYNHSGLDDDIFYLISHLQNEFEKRGNPDDKKKLIVMCQMFLLKKSEYFQFQYFADKILNRLISGISLDAANNEKFGGFNLVGATEFNGNFEITNIVDTLLPKIEISLKKSDYSLMILGYKQEDYSQDFMDYSYFDEAKKTEFVNQLKGKIRLSQTFGEFNSFIDCFLLQPKLPSGSIALLIYNNRFSYNLNRIFEIIKSIDVKYDAWNRYFQESLNGLIKQVDLLDIGIFEHFCEILQKIFHVLIMDSKQYSILQKSADMWWETNKAANMDMETQWFQIEIQSILEEKFGENAIKEKEEVRGNIDFTVYNIPLGLKVFNDKKQHAKKYYDKTGLDILKANHIDQISQESYLTRCAFLIAYDYRKENVKTEILTTSLNQRISFQISGDKILALIVLGYRYRPSDL